MIPLSDFHDRPFAAGSLIGLRAFGVDVYGRLTGPSRGGVFGPGENRAECKGGRWSALTPPGSTITGRSNGFNLSGEWKLTLANGDVAIYPSWLEIANDYPNPGHVVGSGDCHCGYYAFFNGDHTFARANRVSALIEGYGVCTVGTKGFRAGKARLVAIVDPTLASDEPADSVDDDDQLSRLERWRAKVKPYFYPTLMSTQVGFGIYGGVRGDWAAMSVNIAVFLFLGLLWATSHISKKVDEVRAMTVTSLPPAWLELDDQPPVNWSLVRRNYPDVPMYRTIEAALAAHPLTPPPVPSPDDDEDFWTRPEVAP